MPKYKANSTVLNLSPGDTFESDDEFYQQFAAGGFISVITDEDDAAGEQSGEHEHPPGGDSHGDQSGGPELGADLGNGEGPDA